MIDPNSTDEAYAQGLIAGQYRSDQRVACIVAALRARRYWAAAKVVEHITRETR